MKRIYICPQIRVIRMNSFSMLAASDKTVSVVDGEYNGTFNTKRENPTPSSVWEDDWSKQ